ncbi:MAG: S8 family serine peptidase [Deltaproteobacteria bacterium]|nr:S8 family serine peptidase [Deltaproteobacteria bacterium]
MKKPEGSCNPLLFITTLIALFLAAERADAASSQERAVIIGFHKKPSQSEQALLHNHRGRMKHAFRLINAWAANIPEQEIFRLRADPRIKYVAEDEEVYAVDPEPSSAEYSTSWGISRIGCQSVHEQGVTGSGVRIAVLDSGIDYTHPEFLPSYQGGYDFVFDDSVPFDDSWNSHGTHVSGIITAAADGNGVIGGAPDASLYAVKVLDGAGFGLLSFVISGLEWAVENKMDIANLSIAGPDSPALREACDAAYAAGLLLVAAAGNTRQGDVLYPAAYDSVIAVSASDQSDLPAYFSPMDTEIELMAPGVEIQSTVSGGGYGLLSGTSQAAPHVTAAAALIMSAGAIDVNFDGVINNLDVRQLLQQTAIDLGDPGRDELYGFGLVDAAAAIAADGDVDGLDLVVFANQLAAGANDISLEAFATNFGGNT